MAHFAKIGADNKVIAVYVCGNADTRTDGGLEKEEIGAAFLKAQFDGETWKQCSYNSNFRGNFAGIGHTYMTGVRTLGVASTDIFIEQQPYLLSLHVISSKLLDNPINLSLLLIIQLIDGQSSGNSDKSTLIINISLSK